MLFWFLKMFIKVLKPFAKAAVIEALLEAVNNVYFEEETTASEEETQETAE